MDKGDFNKARIDLFNQNKESLPEVQRKNLKKFLRNQTKYMQEKPLPLDANGHFYNHLDLVQSSIEIQHSKTCDCKSCGCTNYEHNKSLQYIHISNDKFPDNIEDWFVQSFYNETISNQCMPSFYKVQEDYGGMQNLLEGRSEMETMGESEKLHFARSVAKDLAECSSPSSINRSNFILNKLLIVCVGQPCGKTLFTEGMSHNIRSAMTTFLNQFPTYSVKQVVSIFTPLLN